MPRDYPTLEEILADLEDAAERLKEKYAEYTEPSPRHSQGQMLQIVSILIWLAGLGSCFVLAWWGSGESRLLTTITMIFPCWHGISLACGDGCSSCRSA
jgi:hypothetical protein